ncbi:MAG: hypothetical protein PWP65_78 [Clostridia bacterium]|nr:hypothetical protein [Clostridia bacterium]
MVKLTYFGHAAFAIIGDNASILIDPWFKGNTLAAPLPDDFKADLILVTHGHYDHLGDAIELSQKFGSPILAVSELARYCLGLGAKAMVGHFGGTFKFDFGWVKFVPAWHSSSVGQKEFIYTGNPCGFLVHCGEKTIYHAGDTCLFSDMKLIGETAPIDVALLPIGDRVTMGMEDALRAVKLLQPKVVIPMHYNTWEAINQDPYKFKLMVEGDTPAKCIVLDPGQGHEL